MIYRCLAAMAMAVCFATGSLAATTGWVVESNKLVGATNVNVGGTLYDVTFADGSCISLFGGCTNSSFVFSTYAQAYAANTALSNSVFLDVPAGNFNSVPELTAGCSMGIGCTVLTPYSLVGANVYYASVDNTPGIGFISGTHEGFYVVPSYSTNTWNDKTFAVWSVSPVPEPETYAMLLAGLGVMGFIARRRKQA